eukprot:m.248538 g.248538  ORF g.248538 m.248538 type:complete len:438 (+) comp16133_c0_seq38:87-1400(+)
MSARHLRPSKALAAIPRGSKNEPNISSPKTARRKQNQDIQDTDAIILQAASEIKPEKVYAVNMDNHKLTEIPSFKNFPNIQTLDLSFNRIAQIRGLSKNTRLKELLLSSNALTSLEGLATLKELRVLELQRNSCKATGHYLTSLGKLESLRLDFNKLESLSQLPSAIKSLHVGCNQLTTLNGISNLISLESLFASHNLLIEIDLPKLSKLTELDLSGNTGMNLTTVKNAPKLQILRLARCGLKEFEAIPSMKSLEQLHLHQNTLSGVYQVSSRFPKLDVLDITENNIAELQSLDLHKSNITELNIRGNPIISSEGIKTLWNTLLELLPQLEIIDGKELDRENSTERPSSSWGRPVTALGRRPGTAQTNRHLKIHGVQGPPLMRPMTAEQTTEGSCEVQIPHVLEDTADLCDKVEQEAGQMFNMLRSTLDDLKNLDVE